jgi:hypothetical protein
MEAFDTRGNGMISRLHQFQCNFQSCSGVCGSSNGANISDYLLKLFVVLCEVPWIHFTPVVVTRICDH